MPVQVIPPKARDGSEGAGPTSLSTTRSFLGIVHAKVESEPITKGDVGALDMDSVRRVELTGKSRGTRLETGSRHASKVSRRAGPTLTFTNEAQAETPHPREIKQLRGRPSAHTPARKSTHLSGRPSKCPPLDQPRQDMPTRMYPKPSSYERGNCSCTPVAPFILLSMQRSGSGWVETLLNSHPNLRSHGEVFKVRKREEGWNETRAALEAVFNMEKVKEEKECLSAVGLKWMLNQVRHVAGSVPFLRICLWTLDFIYFFFEFLQLTSTYSEALPFGD
jgi:hypothetical protein